jgi:hypothetical protein
MKLSGKGTGDTARRRERHSEQPVLHNDMGEVTVVPGDLTN